MEKKWNGASLSQEDFMNKDQVIVLDENDNIVGKGSKFETHRFVPGQPRGILHRAFSVFLFGKSGKLLLQQRAKSKITFPNVWTNTCCSHPLMGFNPTEVDSPSDVANGTVGGVKRAAVRKLKHELGIEEAAVPLEDFKYLTRLHYYASDILTHGKHRWVSCDELIHMFADEQLLWSPWFKIIAERWLIPHWWKNLTLTLTTDQHVDLKKIHRFDPPPAHRGGAGICGLAEESVSTELRKQGAYGKVPVIIDSKFKQMMHLDEVVMMFLYKVNQSFSGSKSNVKSDSSSDKAFCDEMLGKVSRSFAAVIRQLPVQVCTDIMIFYLALRALDTIEDDMTAFKDQKDKIFCLENFYQTVLVGKPRKLITERTKSIELYITENGMNGIGNGDERKLLENFSKVSRVFSGLDEKVCDIISNIAERMGKGMAEFVTKDLGQGTASLEEYNRYCHYVAGLVGQGLTRLFAATMVENPSIADDMHLPNSMGLFLQKVNVIRDYLEDYVDGRAFWPAEVWKKYAVKTALLGELSLPENRAAAVGCLNELITDALGHVPDCIKYMDQCKNVAVFKFCAIPQAMAVSTLELLYDNPRLFEGVVKLRRGTTAKIILQCGSSDGLARIFERSIRKIRQKVRPNDPNSERTKKTCDELLRMLSLRARQPNLSPMFVLYLGIIFALRGRYLLNRVVYSPDSPMLIRLEGPFDFVDFIAIAIMAAGLFKALSIILRLVKSRV